MSSKPMKILIIEDDKQDCKNFTNSVNNRNDIEIVGITDSDIEALNLTKIKHPEGIVLDLELHNSQTGSADAIDFISKLKKMKLNYEPIVIVTTHINSTRTYDILHREGADIILYKDQPQYSADYVLNRFISLRKEPVVTVEPITMVDKIKNDEEKIRDYIGHELDLVGITNNLKGRSYISDAILYIIQNEGKIENINSIQYVSKMYKKSQNTITNGIKNAIDHGWKVTPINELEQYYSTRVNFETGVPTPMEFLYYYVEKVKKMI